MIFAIINYGMGNLASVRRAFEDLGENVFVATDPIELLDADKLILPGVGSFQDGMRSLKEGGWIEAIRRQTLDEEKPLLGICLGMQMLATIGYEGGVTDGLDLIPGQIEWLRKLGCNERLPHVGWNEVNIKKDVPLLDHITDKSDFYFVHSFAFTPQNSESLIATTPYGYEIPAVVQNGNIYGCQFHPKKSSQVGRQLLKNFIDL